MNIGTPYSAEFSRTDYDVIVIGSGISGLTLAALLSQQGRKVLVLERHYTAGGATHTFSRKGFEWDTGVHYVGDVHDESHPFRKTFDFISGHKLKWSKLNHNYDSFVFPDDIYHLKSGRENFQQMLNEKFPSERKAIAQYLDLIKKASRSTRSLSVSKLSQWLSPFPSYPKFFHETTYDVLSSLTKDQRLIGVLTGQFGNYGLPPRESSFGVHAVIADHYMDGASFPEGGSSEIARTIVSQIEKHGGKVLVRAAVKKVLCQKGEAYGVELENGDHIRGKKIVSSAGVHVTFSNFFSPEDLPSEYVTKNESIRPSHSYLSLAIGLDMPASKLNHAGGNIWVFPGYDHDENLKRFLVSPEAPLPVAYYSFPGLKDSKWRERKGDKCSIDVIGLAPYDWFSPFGESSHKRRPEEYETLKEKLSKPYLDQLRQLFPHIAEEISHVEISSPLTVRHYLNYPRGELYGLQLDVKRFKQDWLKPQTPIKNFYMTGQDILMNGVCGAMMSGVLTSTYMFPIATLRQLAPLGVYNAIK